MPRFPFHLLHPFPVRELAGKDKQVVGEAVDVFEQQTVHLFLLREVENAALGTAAYGARHMAGGHGG